MGVPQSTKWNPALRGPMISGPIQLAFDTFETPVVMFSSGSGYHVNTQTISISCSLVVVPSVQQCGNYSMKDRESSNKNVSFSTRLKK